MNMASDITKIPKHWKIDTCIPFVEINSSLNIECLYLLTWWQNKQIMKDTIPNCIILQIIWHTQPGSNKIQWFLNYLKDVLLYQCSKKPYIKSTNIKIYPPQSSFSSKKIVLTDYTCNSAAFPNTSSIPWINTTESVMVTFIEKFIWKSHSNEKFIQLSFNNRWLTHKHSVFAKGFWHAGGEEGGV